MIDPDRIVGGHVRSRGLYRSSSPDPLLKILRYETSVYPLKSMVADSIVTDPTSIKQTVMLVGRTHPRCHFVILISSV